MKHVIPTLITLSVLRLLCIKLKLQTEDTSIPCWPWSFPGALSLQLSALSGGHLRAPGPSTGRCFRAVPDIESLGLSTLYLAAVAAGGFLFFALKFKPLLILPPMEVEGIAFLFVFVAGCVQPLKSREATWKVAGCGVISLSLEAQF